MRLVATVTVLILLALPGLAGCGGDDGSRPAPRPTPPAPFMLDFESGLTLGDAARTVTNAGPADVQTAVRSTGDATVQVVAGPDGGQAVRFPAFTGAATAPVAVLVATEGGSGALDPGDGRFTFGASFRLDDQSAGSAADN